MKKLFEFTSVWHDTAMKEHHRGFIQNPRYITMIEDCNKFDGCSILHTVQADSGISSRIRVRGTARELARAINSGCAKLQ